MVKLITTFAVRGSAQGESHGGACIIDIEAQDVRQVLDWDTVNSDRRGGDGDRGLRGVAIDGATVYVVASEELFAFTKDFEPIGSWRNRYLKYAHEICIYERKLYITSTGYDSVLAFDLDERRFFWALHIDLDRFNFKGSTYDPMGDEGPLLLNKLHLNSVHANENGLYIAGAKSAGMLHFNGETVYVASTLPKGVHNAQPWRDGVLFNDSDAKAVRYASRSGEEDRAVKVPKYESTDDDSLGVEDSQAAGPDFARGLCAINDRVVAAGSSPATISVHDLQASRTLLSVNLSKDLRTAIHGIQIWPF